MKTYIIEINEEQRQALLFVLKEFGIGFDDDSTPLEYWQGMLEELPDLEEDNDTKISRFCL